LLGESLEVLISGDGFFYGGNLLARNVAGDVFALLAGLKFIKWPRRALFDDGELAPFHGLNLSNSLKDLRE